MNPADWIPVVYEIYGQLAKFILKNSHEGIYEMLEYDSILELADPRGEVATFRKRQRVRFLQDHVIAFQDHIWGDGEVLADYKCSPGVAVDHYKDGDRWNVLISLRATKSSGDIEDFHIQRRVVNALSKNEEWWQFEMYHQTRRLKFSIIFPRTRHCRSAMLIERNRNRTQILDSEYFSKLPDGRQVLTWEKEQPIRFETYTIKWRW